MTKYNDEMKNKAIELSYEIGCKKASEQLGISPATLSCWRRLKKEQEEVKLSKVQTAFNPEKELAGNSFVSFQSNSEEKRDFKRGEIYYIARGVTSGAEVATGRPAVIVSKEGINKNLSTLEVVYLTTKPKAILPEHVVIRSSGITSTVLCEQISTIDTSRIKEKIGECTPEEMERIDVALLSSLGLNKYSVAYASSDKVLSRVSTIMAERDAYKDMCNRLLQK